MARRTTKKITFNPLSRPVAPLGATRIVNGHRVPVHDPFASAKEQRKQVREWNEKNSRGINMAKRTSVPKSQQGLRPVSNATGPTYQSGGTRSERAAAKRSIKAAMQNEKRKVKEAQNKRVENFISYGNKRVGGGSNDSTTIQRIESRSGGKVRYAKRKGIYEKNRRH